MPALAHSDLPPPYRWRTFTPLAIDVSLSMARRLSLFLDRAPHPLATTPKSPFRCDRARLLRLALDLARAGGPTHDDARPAEGAHGFLQGQAIFLFLSHCSEGEGDDLIFGELRPGGWTSGVALPEFLVAGRELARHG